MQSQPDVRDLTDLIYAALLGERSWQDFLDQLKLLLPNGKALLFFHDAAVCTGAFPLAAALEPDHNAAYASYYSRLNPWMHGACVRPVGRVVRAETMVPHKTLTKTEFYSDWLRPQSLETGIGVTILREEHCNFLLSILSAEAGDDDCEKAVKTTQALVPHLKRAFNWYRRDERGAVGLFDGTGIGESLRVGILSVGPGRKVRMANHAAASMLDRVSGLSIDAAGRLRCSAHALLEAIESVQLNWMRDRRGAPPATFILAKRNLDPPIRVTVLAPSREHGPAFFRGPECILLLEIPSQNMEFAVEEFGALHGLSTAERRVVEGLTAGLTLEQVGARAQISPHTARFQLKQVFAKTGLGRQVDLVRHVCLLSGRSVGSLAATARGSPGESH